MEYLQILGKTYQCNIIRENIKRVYIQYKENVVIIKCPKRMKDNDILNIIENNEIKIAKIINKVNNKVKYSYENGSEIPFYGQKLKIIYSNELLIRNGYMYLDARNPKESYNLLAKKYGEIFYKERINYFISKYNLPYKVNKIVIREMKTRYGVCNIRDKKITFQTHLAVYPLECIDYVIVHELSHFKVQNHSKEFYYEVAKILPDYKIRQKRLKEIY